MKVLEGSYIVLLEELFSISKVLVKTHLQLRLGQTKTNEFS